MNDSKTVLKAVHFAAKKHAKQTRKGSRAEPYINHPLEVANLLAEVGNIQDTDLLVAAILHDTIEDTETDEEEVAAHFGEAVAKIVLEVSDDKMLTGAEREQRQIDHAPKLSKAAKQLKMADKISNIAEVLDDPPVGWSPARRFEYIEWGEKVMAGLRGANEPLEKRFDELIEQSKRMLNS